MKFVKLLTAAHVAGVLRHPHEGVLTVSDDDAKRLVEDEQIATDVSADFADQDTSSAVAETTQETAGGETPRPPANPHLWLVETDDPPQPAPEPATHTKRARRQAAGDQE